ncbi:MAG: hypothetical protein NC246_15595, partial [Muribaculaceae bacterium]|nr:hypothetical protein [Muribaculaceae bacterium]
MLELSAFVNLFGRPWQHDCGGLEEPNLGRLRKGMVIKMAKRRRRTYSYQKFSYQSSRERERKRKRRRIAVLSVMAALLLLGAGFAVGRKLLRTDAPEEIGAVLTGGPVLAEDVSGVPEADGQ